jgi:quercetin 2,3-dioxygenase
VTGLDQRLLVARRDGSLGPLLRVADDRLPPGSNYGIHEHRAVDVVAVVVSGSLLHDGETSARLSAGDVAMLRSGTGLRHDERAGDGGARVLQCYLRTTDPAAPASHAVLRRPEGWVDLARPDARLWIGSGEVTAPPGLVLAATSDDVAVSEQVEPLPVAGADLVIVWQLDVRRPDWAST